MAIRFSCTCAFIASYFLSIALKRGNARVPMKIKNAASTGMAKANTTASSAFRRTAIMVAAMSISGERTSVRMIIIKDCCTFVTSVVRRVIRDAVEK